MLMLAAGPGATLGVAMGLSQGVSGNNTTRTALGLEKGGGWVRKNHCLWDRFKPKPLEML